jgi:hypothetical protein
VEKLGVFETADEYSAVAFEKARATDAAAALGV